MNKQYRLLKDLPMTNAGIVFKRKTVDSSVYFPSDGGGWLAEIPEEIVEGCPHFFELIEDKVEEPFVWTENKVLELISLYCSNYTPYNEISWGKAIAKFKKQSTPNPSLEYSGEVVESKDWEIVTYRHKTNGDVFVKTIANSGNAFLPYRIHIL